MNSEWQLHEDVEGFGPEPLSYGKEGSVLPKNHVLLRENEPRLERNIPIFQKLPWNHEAS